MTQALYRKWRPQTFDQIVGQEHVTRTLRNALTAGRVGHAYLFAGLRGTGKTTMARLLAKAVNCLAKDPAERPCNQCAICQAVNEGRLLDLIEIDAASHTSVDDVRELRDKVGFRPNECRYKVYIIDEVHRFSGSAFDALLKTIEEPPPHAIFVLATTEIHKVPATILSRCQRFDFRRIPLKQVVGRLRTLAQAEGFVVAPEALSLIARSATGSMRDAESLLDQLAATAGGKVSLEQVQATLGIIDAEFVAQLVDALVVGDVAAGLALINQAMDQGVDLRQFTRQVVDHLRGMLLLQLDGASLLDLPVESLERLMGQAERIEATALIKAIKRFNQAETELRGGWQPQLPLELALVEAAVERPVEAEPSRSVPEAPQERPAAQPAQPTPVTEPQSQEASSGLTVEQVKNRWSQILQEVRGQDPSVQALLNSTRPGAVAEGQVILDVEHEFARGKLDETRARGLVETVLNRVLGQPCRVVYRMASPKIESTEPEPGDELEDDPLVQAMKQMGAQVKPIEGGST